MKFGKALGLFLSGHFFGAVVATSIAHYQELGWDTGPEMIGLSLPTTAVYFIGLWVLGSWKPILLNSGGLAVAGFASAIYPTFCGVLPIYVLRLGLAIPFIGAQFAFVIAMAAVFSLLEKHLGS
jgi:hypothetical protein